MIAAGIRRVVYIEPYPKSKAKQLNADAIRIEGTAEAASSGRRVPFEPFLGISPRRYAELFCAKGPGFNIQRKDDGRAAEWRRGQFGPRIPLQPIGYLQREQLAAEELSRLDKIAYVGETHGNEERPQRPRLNARVPRRKR